ncbi:hypothetical protein Lbir_1876 [Legionella birminghamensis]|uniref:Uncharacterized protein n=1 Tax=Legionella birminghamensis TaxID=28083 RepID=A0A378IAV6_9GAMM|nr:hypothetical protein [Legionella birminghamensis]KTC70101.1 hypothetical protein Lbir_1876 [Legionella birminghamensis]STX32006.1 Uncharacterised protein [Legionella birminghamensis]
MANKDRKSGSKKISDENLENISGGGYTPGQPVNLIINEDMGPTFKPAPSPGYRGGKGKKKKRS